MKTPSVKALRATFRDLTAEQASLIKRLAAARDDREALATILESECPVTWAYLRSCYNDPLSSRMWRTTMVLHAIDTIVGTCGVEALGDGEGPSYAPPFEYLNAGDTYAATLVYKRASDRLFVGCWGDVAERLPASE